MKGYKELNFFEKMIVAVNCITKRNRIICHDYNRKAKEQVVNLNYWRINSTDNEDNLGDYLSLIIYNYMLERFGLDKSTKLKKTKHLYAIGSILFTGFQDCTVWGTGLIREYDKTISEKITLFFNKYFRKLDIRCVRGPNTREILLKHGICCPECYGDPALLMPIIYEKREMVKKEEYLIVLHYTNEIKNDEHTISMKTKEYEYVIDRICSAKKVITNSLHGLILSEAYGVPAILLDKDGDLERFKYDDYYLSTGRINYPIATSVEEALQMNIIPISDTVVNKLREDLLSSFPIDLWDE